MNKQRSETHSVVVPTNEQSVLYSVKLNTALLKIDALTCFGYQAKSISPYPELDMYIVIFVR